MTSENPSQKATLAQDEEIQHQIKALSKRDVQLWSIAALMVLVIAAGYRTAAEVHLFSNVFFGLVTLVVLLNVYAVGQGRVLSATRWQLVQELALNEKLASASWVDPLTQAVNRQSMDFVVARELSRANRLGTNLTFLLLEVRHYKPTGNRTSHHDPESALLAEAGKLLRATFRGLDIVVRYSQQSFLVVMPDTDQPQAGIALGRLTAELDNWNLSNTMGLELTLDHGMASYVKGAHVDDVVRVAARNLSLQRNVEAPSFPPSASASPVRMEMAFAPGTHSAGVALPVPLEN